jgi:hypothetical protein
MLWIIQKVTMSTRAKKKERKKLSSSLFGAGKCKGKFIC